MLIFRVFYRVFYHAVFCLFFLTLHVIFNYGMEWEDCSAGYAVPVKEEIPTVKKKSA